MRASQSKEQPIQGYADEEQVAHGRDDRKRYLIYPEDEFKGVWDVFMAMTLLFTCIATPLRVAFYETDNLQWTIINYIVDFAFFLDIFVSFNSAYYDQDFKIIEQRNEIAYKYFHGWFLLDLLSIFPFEVVGSLG